MWVGVRVRKVLVIRIERWLNSMSEACKKRFFFYLKADVYRRAERFFSMASGSTTTRAIDNNDILWVSNESGPTANTRRGFNC